MKKIVVLAALVLSIIACKNETQPAPDQPLETQSDTIKKDTIAALGHTKGALLAMNFEAKKNPLSELQEPTYAAFGAKMTADKAINEAAMLKKYKSLKTGDTVAVKFKSKITSVCKKKGCWMKVTLPEGKESFVRFKDYGFFVPLNADNTNAVMSGKAYIDVISVDELKHYAKDGGKSQEEINKIKEPKVTYAFLADGVLLEK